MYLPFVPKAIGMCVVLGLNYAPSSLISDSLVVVHFWAPWSQPCQQMNEALEELAKEHENVKFVKVGWMDRQVVRMT